MLCAHSPPMPRGVSAEMSGLIARCWDAKPAERPAFSLIVDMLKDACNKHGIPLTGKVRQRHDSTLPRLDLSTLLCRPDPRGSPPPAASGRMPWRTRT